MPHCDFFLEYCAEKQRWYWNIIVGDQTFRGSGIDPDPREAAHLHNDSFKNWVAVQLSRRLSYGKPAIHLGPIDEAMEALVETGLTPIQIRELK